MIRFASSAEPLGAVPSHVTRVLRVGPDAASVAWVVRLASGAPVSVCGLVASLPART